MNRLLCYDNKLWSLIHEFTYTGAKQRFTLEPGTYLLECNGAPGGYNSEAYPGSDAYNYGGTTRGIITLNERTDLVACVGGQGMPGSIGNKTLGGLGGWNYGGCGSCASSDTNYTGNGGGGASDVRLDIPDSTLIQQGHQIPRSDLSNEYQEVSCIYADTRINSNHCFLDTRVIPSEHTEIQYEGYATRGSIFGCDKCFNITCESGNYVAYNLSGERIVTDIQCDTTIHKFYLSNTKFVIDNQEFLFTNVDFNPDWGSYSLYLLNRSTGHDTVDSDELSQCMLKECKIYQDTTLVRDYIPCRTKRFMYSYTSLKDTYGLYDPIEMMFHHLNPNDNDKIGIGKDIIDPTLYSRLIVAGGGGGCFNYNVSGFNYIGCGGGIVGGYFGSDAIYPAYNVSTTKALVNLQNIIQGSKINYNDETHEFSLSGNTDASFKWHAARMVVGKRFIVSFKVTKEFSHYIKIRSHVENGHLLDTFNRIIECDEYDIVVNDFIPTSREDYFEFSFDGSYWNDGSSDYAKFWDGLMEVSSDMTSDISDIISPYVDFTKARYATQTYGNAFGYGGDAYLTTPTTTNCYGHGGGGGGWFGGYGQTESCGNQYNSQPTYCGTGGSGYVYTEDSYKPQGYLLNQSYYMTSPFFESGSAVQGANVQIYKQTKYYATGDQITFPCVGHEESVKLQKGTYTLECYGGDGSARYNYNVIKVGGYTRGTLNVDTSLTLYCNVGGSGNGTMFGGSSDYIQLLHPTLSYNGGGACTNIGYVGGGAGGGATDFRLISKDEPNSLYSRIIVAGGAGGVGANTGSGGSGGGITGEAGSGAWSVGANGGTQTSGNAFGYGGDALSGVGGHGGAGGGGWYGGVRSTPANYNGDHHRGGGGGSGYVLTETSEKPSGYIPGKQFYMTNVVNEQAMSLPRGMSKAVIMVNKISPALILCKDTDGFKYFDENDNQWKLLDSQLITVDTFSDYGIPGYFTIDDGLLDDYDIYAYELSDPISTLQIYVSPPQQHIIAYTDTDMLVSKIVHDTETYENNFTYDVILDRNTDSMKLEMHLYVDKLIPDNEFFRIYSTQFYGNRYIRENEYKPERPHGVPRRDPEQYRDQQGNIMTAQYLLPVGNSTTITHQYGNYIGSDIVERFPNWEFRSSIARDYERTIYIAIIGYNNPNYILYLRAYSPFTGICETIYLGIISEPGVYYITDFIISDDKIYLSLFNNTGHRTSLQIFDMKTNQFTQTASDPDGDTMMERYKSARGRIEKWNSTKIMMLSWHRILLYDTLADEWDYIQLTPTPEILSNKSQVRMYYDYAIGDHLICATDEPSINDTFNNVYLYDRNTGEGICIKVDGLNSNGSYERYGLVQYFNGRFFICYRNALVVINESTKQIESKFTGMPWDSPLFMNVYNHSVAIGVTNGRIYVYNIHTDQFNFIYSNWNILPRIPSTTYGENYNGYRVNNTYQQFNTSYRLVSPAVIGGYCFIPYNTMCMINLTSNGVYDMGEKFERYMIYFNSDHSDEFVYDPRFVDLSGSCLRVHNGIIEYSPQNTDLGSNIKKYNIHKSDYTKIVDMEITTIEQP